MGLEQAREAMQSSTPAASEAPKESSSSMDHGAGATAAAGSNGDLAPDSASSAPESSNVLDLSKAEKFLWEGKEMTPDELRKNFLRQQDYTKKTQALAEDRRRFDEKHRAFITQQEESQKYDSNLDADIQNVLRDPALREKFMEIYPAKYHAKLEQAMNQAFGEENSPNRSESLLEQRLKSIESRFLSQDTERQKTAFETEVSKNAEILDSTIDRMAAKYPHADEDSVLARAEHMSMFIKKDNNFRDNFTQMLEKLYKENHAFHEGRYKSIYKTQVEKQKQANSRGRDIGAGGATPGAAPAKIKFKDVKNHIINGMG